MVLMSLGVVLSTLIGACAAIVNTTPALPRGFNTQWVCTDDKYEGSCIWSCPATAGQRQGLPHHYGVAWFSDILDAQANHLTCMRTSTHDMAPCSGTGRVQTDAEIAGARFLVGWWWTRGAHPQTGRLVDVLAIYEVRILPDVSSSFSRLCKPIV